MIKQPLLNNLCLFALTALFFWTTGCRPAEPIVPTQMPTAVMVRTFTPQPTPTHTPVPTVTETAVPTSTPVIQRPSATPLPTNTPPATATTPANAITQTVGLSVQQRPIVDYQFKNGPNHIVFVGGMHGGYEQNTVALAERLAAHFAANPQDIPADWSVIIVPAANPDGLLRGQNAEGRFNAHGVDLNRNWGCGWEPAAVWRPFTRSGPRPCWCVVAMA